ncbi:hypothetical protein HJFPF1_06220 [Paramyrothecium foliicola]|nr:hypothetical protein HJFPF1_06220 [Paramyrothecium foliicola]
MRCSLISAALVAGASAHGVVTSIKGANGVVMPGLSIADGTPRDCSSNGCGSQADTAIIRDREMGGPEASALGRTQGNGPIDAAAMIANFMGTGGANAVPTNNGSASSVGQEDDLSGLQELRNQRNEQRKRQIGGLLGGLMGGGRGGNAQGQASSLPAETFVADSAGSGAAGGLPTCSDSGEVTLVYRQINQDGAGPLSADVDGKSGGTDANAFQSAEVTSNVPGLAAGISLATNTDFPVTVQMPQGMTCDASVGGANNVCIVRVRNATPAGPFGGSAAFTQSAGARKRAIAYRLKKRMELAREE